jgi:tetratricopeptide (TPR) repeat protein
VALLKCLEPVTAIGCALFGVAPIAGALATGGVKIATLFAEHAANHGFDSGALIEKMQAAAFRAADHYDRNVEWRDALTNADAALRDHLGRCLPSRDDLTGCAAQADFGGAVQALVLDRISAIDAQFATLSAADTFCPRSFAGDIIRAVLDAALADEKYVQSLTLPLQLATVHGVSAANIKLDRLLALVEGSTLPDHALRGALARFVDFQPGASDTDVLNAVTTFERGYHALIEQVSHINVHDNHIQSLKIAAEEALQAGDIATTRTRYAEAAKAAAEKASEPVCNAAALKSAEASAALTMLDWQAADAAWAQAAAMLMPFDVRRGEAIVGEATERLYYFGDVFGQTPALVASEHHCRKLEAAAKLRGDHERVAIMQHNLGITLSLQGQRTVGDAGLALLAEAVAEYSAALSVRTETAVPAYWAMTQNNLGNVLSVQGERTGGDAGLVLLQQAVAAYRAALCVYTEAAMPTNWAATQNNLGNVLRAQGERMEGDAGLALLAEAIAAYRAALRVRTETAMPADWAMTQNNLGNVLRVQGERTGDDAGLALLAEAVAACRAALRVYKQAAMPVDWAKTENNLGIVLRIQGEWTGGDAGLALLAEAAAVYRAALSVYTQTAMPVDWAMTQNNLGNVLRVQGEMTVGNAGLALLAEAVAALTDALSIWTPEHFSHYHQMASNNLAKAEAAIAERRG